MPSTATFRVRPARPDDRDRVLAFCAQTWDFGDYIDRVWDRWLNDPASQLLVAVDQADRPVALANARGVAPGEAWLEGLRVDPAVRRQGLAEILALAAVAACRRRGARTIRFATLATNTPIHRLMPRLGFRQIASFAIWHAPALTETDPAAADFVPTTSDPAAVAAFAAGSDTVRSLAGLLVAGWTYAHLTLEVLQDWADRDAGRLYQLPAQGAPAAYAWLDSAAAESALPVPWLAAQQADLAPACLALRRLAGRLGRPGVDLRLPAGDAFVAAARSAGFTSDAGSVFWIYAAESAAPGLLDRAPTVPADPPPGENA